MSFELPFQLKIDELVDQIDADFSLAHGFKVSKVGPLSDTCDECLTFYTGRADNALEVLSKIATGSVVCIAPEARAHLNRTDIGYIVASSPRYVFTCIVDFFMRNHVSLEKGISPLSHLNDTATIGNNVVIGPFVTVCDGAVIGDNCIIEHGAYIGSRVVVKKDVRIGANTTIGVEGQSSEKDSTGRHVFLHHFAAVIIGQGSRVGANSVIVRGSLRDTIIGRYCTIGHRVSIGHNCIVGDNCFISAGTTLAGSSELSDDVWLAPDVSVLNKIKIDEGAIIGLGSVVTKSVGTGKFAVGNPARELRQIDKTKYNRKNN